MLLYLFHLKACFLPDLRQLLASRQGPRAAAWTERQREDSFLFLSCSLDFRLLDIWAWRASDDVQEVLELISTAAFQVEVYLQERQSNKIFYVRIK